MAKGDQWARGVAIARQVREENPGMGMPEQAELVRKRWNAIERDVATMRRRPRS